MLPIWKDSDTDKWYYSDGEYDIGPFESFALASEEWAKSRQSCKNGNCES